MILLQSYGLLHSQFFPDILKWKFYSKIFIDIPDPQHLRNPGLPEPPIFEISYSYP